MMPLFYFTFIDMKKLVLFTLSIICFTLVNAQVPRFTKYDIGESAGAAYFPGEPEFSISYSEDSSLVYTADVEVDSFVFSIIAIDFKESIGDDKMLNEALLISYLDFLQSSFAIVSAAGYGKGHTTEYNPEAVGVIDYWADDTGTPVQVKGWVDGNNMAVMLIIGPGEYPIFNVSQMFLNGYRFPE